MFGEAEVIRVVEVVLVVELVLRSKMSQQEQELCMTMPQAAGKNTISPLI